MKANRKLFRTANRFGIDAKHIKRIQNGVYHLTTKDGQQYCIKKIRCSVVSLKWIDRTLQKLMKNGYNQISWRKPNTVEGKKLFIKTSKFKRPYVLAPWISGRWPSPTSLQDMVKCGEVLAKFHLSGQKLPKYKSGAVNMVGEWPKLFRGYLDRLQLKAAKAERNGHGTDLDSFLQTNGSEIIQYAKEGIQILQSSDYKRVCLEARKSCTLCHGDGGPTNFIQTAKGMYLIDFETLRYDLRAYDLFRVIYNSCKDHDWKVEIAEAILDGYHSVSKLTQTDIDLLSAWLRFPRKICKALDSYGRLNRRQKAVRLSNIKQYFQEDRRITVFLQQLNAKGKYQ